MSDNRTITLCMIVKNEERYLARCLKSAQPLVHEMIVVDTGSRDRTMEIARQFGAKIYQHEWQNSFSEARNYALTHVNSEWVLQLDADEELEQQDIPLAKKVVELSDYHAVYVAILNYLPRGRSKFYYPRLYRRGKAHYEGIVHNQVLFEGKPLHTEIRIYHYGYNLDSQTMMMKFDRSKKLLEKQLQEDPNDMFAWYNLIRIYRNQANHILAAEKGKFVIEKFPPQQKLNIYLMIINDTVSALIKLQKYQDAIQYAKLALKLKPDYQDILFSLGVAYLQSQQYKKSAKFFSNFIKFVQEEQSVPRLNLLDVGTIDYIDLAYVHLGESQMKLGETELAKKSFQRALAEFEKRSANLPSDIMIHPDILSVLGNACLYLHDFKRAAAFYEQCLEQIPANPRWLNNLASCYAKIGQKEAARLGYMAALQVNPNYQDAKRNLLTLSHI